MSRADAGGLDSVDIGPSAAGSRVPLRVMPRAPKSGLGGVRDGRVLVRVTAAPVDGAANQAVIDALARALDVPRSAVRIAAGATSRNKTAEIAGLAPAVVRLRLASLVTP